jgi:hypothetical protein
MKIKTEVMKKILLWGLWQAFCAFPSLCSADGLSHVVSHTEQIGSVDAPTFDGGIINSPEYTRVISVVTKLKPVHLSHQSHLVVEKLLAETPQAQQSDSADLWATRTTAKRLLRAALQDGKLASVLSASKRMHLPASVALVPMVESNYQTKVVSPKGAVGAWQLMPGTASDYGLKPEERVQFARSTDAALHLLSDLHHQFNNWELAFAAYNAGSKRVSDAIKKNPSARRVDELDLPLETKTYVQRLRAINHTIEEISNA